VERMVRWSAVCMAVQMLAVGTVVGQHEGDAADGPVNPLVAKQEMLRDRLRRLEDRMFRLGEKLADSEPASAAKLARALEGIGRAEIDGKVEQLIEMLADDALLSRAGDLQQEMIADMEDVLRVLLEQSDPQARRRRMAELGALRQEVGRTLEEQQALRDEIGGAVESMEEAKRLTQRAGDGQAADSAGRQRDLAERTGELSERMKGGRPGSTPAPGQQNVEQAHRQMRDAADELESDNPGGATRKQDWAVEELAEALEKLEEELHQLRREERQELLGNLESRFAEMLSRQLAVNADTVAVFERSEGGLERVDRLRVAALAQEESALAEAAATCAHILEEDGTTTVFPRVVGQVGDDMATVAGWLSELRLGVATQSLEAEIAAALEDMIAAVRRLQEQDNRPQQGEAAESDGEEPLLPGSAELKLLRAAQSRVNQRTAAAEQARSAGGESVEQISRLLEEAASRQGQVAEMAREIRDRDE